MKAWCTDKVDYFYLVYYKIKIESLTKVRKKNFGNQIGMLYIAMSIHKKILLEVLFS